MVRHSTVEIFNGSARPGYVITQGVYSYNKIQRGLTRNGRKHRPCELASATPSRFSIFLRPHRFNRPRFTVFLRALALLLALLTVTQTQAQSVWSATLTVADIYGKRLGCLTGSYSWFACSTTSVLSDNDFTYGGADYEVERVLLVGDNLVLRLNKAIPSDMKAALTLNVDSSQFALKDDFYIASDIQVSWLNSGLNWSGGDKVSLSLIVTPPPRPTVSLSASPNPVLEGSNATLTATLSQTLSSADVTIPLTVTADSAESEDYRTASSVTIPRGQLEASIGFVTNQDDDEEDETVTIELGTLPTTVTVGTPSSVAITIRDDDQFALSLDATPACGATVSDFAIAPRWTVTLTPSADTGNPFATERRILADTSGTWRSSVSITGSRSAEVTSDNTFAQLRQSYPGFTGFEYRLKDIPSTTAQCTWAFDDAPDTIRPAVRLAALPNPATEGETVTVTAHLTAALNTDLSIPVRLNFEGKSDATTHQIAIRAGATSGTLPVEGTETFTVTFGSLPSSVSVGSPSSVTVTIRHSDNSDDPGDPNGDQEPEDPSDPPGDGEPEDPGNADGGGDPDDPAHDPEGEDQGESIRLPQSGEAIGAQMTYEGMRLVIDLSNAFNDPDGEFLAYEAGSSEEMVAAVEVDGNTLTVRGIGRGVAIVTVTAKNLNGDTASQTFAVTVFGPVSIWYLPPASHPAQHGFVRVLNHSDATGEASIAAIDDAGVIYEPLTLALEPREAVHVSTSDLESGNRAKGLTGATGTGTGGWRLAIDSATLDIEALAYVRTADGYISGMNIVAPLVDGNHRIPFFNPASEIDQTSRLRLVNPSAAEAEATVTGTDDAGTSSDAPVRLTLAAGSSCTVDAQQLESGTGLACGAPQEGLGDGTGTWRLVVASDTPLVAMNLLSSQDGHLMNLSRSVVPDADGIWHAHLFPEANDTNGRQGVVRVVNRSTESGAVLILPSDDTDTQYEALRLSLDAGEAVHVNADDLELGNADKGLTGSSGAGTGVWRLALSSATIDIEVNTYVQTPDGFLTTMQDTAPRAGAVHRVAFFNPGEDDRVSVLRLVNQHTDDAAVTIDGTDDTGLRPGSTVQVMVPATDAVELTATELESGEADAIASGALGDGVGRWRLRIEGEVTVLSLVSSPSGHLTNLSHAEVSYGLGPLPTALLPPSRTVTLENVGDRLLRARWSAVEGARYDIDLLKDGVREEIRSLKSTRSTAIRWWYRSPAGSYTLRVRSVNAEGVRGPWSAHSNEVVFD